MQFIESSIIGLRSAVTTFTRPALRYHDAGCALSARSAIHRNITAHDHKQGAGRSRSVCPASAPTVQAADDGRVLPGEYAR